MWLLATILLCLCHPARAADYHLVGWFNTIVPGGGELLLGRPALATTQATLEIGTFYTGYRMSARSPVTLDGVPEELPTVSSYRFKKRSGAIVQPGRIDITRPLVADILQEFGIKYHMVNVFNAYREAGAKGVDKRGTGSMFLDPFKPGNLADPWFYVPFAISTAALGASYYLQAKAGVDPVLPLNHRSNELYAITYGAVFPFGSGVPEEMFYRGFLQNEFHSLIPSPFFSIPMTTLAYAFSHAAPDRASAAVTGLYLSFLADRFKGDLRRGITYHFWVDVMAGVLAIALLQKAEYHPGPASLAIQFEF